jgi:hypothetical protein
MGLGEKKNYQNPFQPIIPTTSYAVFYCVHNKQSESAEKSSVQKSRMSWYSLDWTFASSIPIRSSQSVRPESFRS